MNTSDYFRPVTCSVYEVTAYETIRYYHDLRGYRYGRLLYATNGGYGPGRRIDAVLPGMPGLVGKKPGRDRARRCDMRQVHDRFPHERLVQELFREEPDDRTQM